MLSNEVIGKRIRNERIKRRMTQKEFASLMGVSESALGKYECGVRRPKDDFRINLSVYTGKTVEELFYK